MAPCPPTSPAAKRLLHTDRYEVLRALASAAERPPEVEVRNDADDEKPEEDSSDKAEEIPLEQTLQSCKHMSEKELASLRQLVQSDVRYGKVVEQCAHALPEVLAAGGPTALLGLLAGVVWQSLRLLWELEPGLEMPKARLQAKMATLEQELEQARADQEQCRRVYFKELTSLRDQMRLMDGETAEGIHRVVHELEPVMFYEPLMYLDTKVREHIADVVEEKLKLFFCQKGAEAAEQTLVQKLAVRADRAEKRAAELQAHSAYLQEMLDERKEGGSGLDRSRNDMKTIKSRLREVMVAVRDNHGYLHDALHELIPERPPLPAPPPADHFLMADHLAYVVEFVRSNMQALLRATNMKVRSRAMTGTDGDELEQRPSFDTFARTLTPTPQEESAFAATLVDRQYVEQLERQLEEKTRQEQQLQELQQKLEQAQKQAATAARAPPTVLATGVDPAHLKKLQAREQELVEKNKELAAALEVARDRNHELEEQIKRLKESLAQVKTELQEVQHRVHTPKAFSQLPKWKIPESNVFKRLHADSKKRIEEREHAAHVHADINLPALHTTFNMDESFHGAPDEELVELLHSAPQPLGHSRAMRTRTSSSSSSTPGLVLGDAASTQAERQMQVAVPNASAGHELQLASPTGGRSFPLAGSPSSPLHRSVTAAEAAADPELQVVAARSATKCALAVHGTLPPPRFQGSSWGSGGSDPLEALHYAYARREAELLSKIEQLEATLESERQQVSEIPRIALKDPRFIASLLSVQQRQSNLSRPLGQWLDDLNDKVPPKTLLTSATPSRAASAARVRAGDNGHERLGQAPLRRPRSAASLGASRR